MNRKLKLLAGGLIFAGLIFVSGSRSASLRFWSAFVGPVTLKRNVDYTKAKLRVNSVRVLKYSRAGERNGQGVILVHGMTPLGENHPALETFAAALVYAGRGPVYVPALEGLKALRVGQERIGEVAQTLAILRKHFGLKQYRLIGSCIGGTTALAALSRLESHELPAQMLLLGGFYRFNNLVDFYNEEYPGAEVRPDLYGRLILFAGQKQNPVLSERVRRFLQSSEPGATPAEDVKQALGPNGYKVLLKERLRSYSPDILSLPDLFQGKSPRFRLFIVHSRSDSLVPYQESLKMNVFFREAGYPVSLLIAGTGEHTRPESSFWEDTRTFLEFSYDWFGS